MNIILIILVVIGIIIIFVNLVQFIVNGMNGKLFYKVYLIGEFEKQRTVPFKIEQSYRRKIIFYCNTMEEVVNNLKYFENNVIYSVNIIWTYKKR